MIYAMSDIHGQYEQFLTLLEQIGIRKEDTLYILGDVVDRGPEPMKILKDRKSTRLNSSHTDSSRMPSSA